MNSRHSHLTAGNAGQADDSTTPSKTRSLLAGTLIPAAAGVAGFTLYVVTVAELTADMVANILPSHFKEVDGASLFFQLDPQPDYLKLDDTNKILETGRSNSGLERLVDVR